MCSPKPNHSTRAAVDIAAPIAWAKRLGGPGTGRARSSLGATTRVASWPSRAQARPRQHPGPEPVNDRDKQPLLLKDDGGDGHDEDHAPATARAATSFTGLGKLNRLPARPLTPKAYLMGQLSGGQPEVVAND